ncbi:hypothetical protein D7I39_07045 [Allopusillimonas ginsengisoli]|nr:hypothetical protein D7I39_07045 [Allopusillimonas ginsengisoli]
MISFLVLFLLTGIGNGSTFSMIPIIFLTKSMRRANLSDPESVRNAEMEGTKEAAAVLGFTGAIGAYGGFFIPKSFGTSISVTGTPHAALLFFIVFYLVAIGVTWWFYSRKNAEYPC